MLKIWFSVYSIHEITKNYQIRRSDILLDDGCKVIADKIYPYYMLINGFFFSSTSKNPFYSENYQINSNGGWAP